MHDLEAEGFEVVDVAFERPDWFEAFLRPRSTFGALVQVVETRADWANLVTDVTLQQVLDGEVLWIESTPTLRAEVDTPVISHFAHLGATISEVLARRAAQDPDHVVISLPDADLAYGELDDRANRMANLLATLGSAPGERCAIMLPNGAPFLTAWFGSGRAGVLDVGLNTGLRGDLLLHQLQLSGATTMVTDATGLGRVEELSDRLEHLRTVVVDGGGGGRSLPGIDVVDLDGALGEASASAPDITVDPRSPAGILFTSGTTGPSKGVMRSHVADFTLASKFIEIMRLEGPETLFTAFPLFHLNAKFNSVLPALLLDGRVVLHDRFSASRFFDICRDEGVTIFNFMGALLTMLMKQPERDGDREHEARCAYGAPAPVEIFADFEDRFGVTLVEVWGSTELGIATHNSVDDMVPGTCGRETSYYEVEIHDADDRPVPDGVQGEFVVRPREPAVLFNGYWEMPEATLAAFSNLWFHTGDRGVRDETGRFRFVDRMKDAIRRRGENISSWEVERSLVAHPDIAEAAIIGVPSELSEEEVLAVLVLRKGAELSPEAVLDHCQDRLPHFAVPRYVRFADELPRNPAQRVEKYKLREDGITDDTWDREDHGYEVRR